MKSIALLLLNVCFYMVSSARQMTVISGTLQDSTGIQQMKGASVVLLNASDSAFIRFTPVLEDAVFRLSHVPYGNYLLQFSFVGFETRYLRIQPDRPEINLDTIYLSPQVFHLGDVVVKQPPVIIRNDTVEFNAGSFPTRAYAVLEELLKKLPGVQVSPEGTIKVNGVAVERLLVDGVPFFGGNPQTATKNLPADIVDKVQVYDASADQKAFNGFDNGPKQRTVNVVIKKNKRKGFFGNATAGMGTSGTYNTGLNLNRFNGNQQLSLVAQGNNINTQVQGNGPSPSPQVSTGINHLASVDFNYRDKWSDKTLAYGNYSYGHQHTTYDQDSHTQNIFTGDSVTINSQTAHNVRTSERHRISFNIDTRPDSLNTLTIRPNASYSKSSSSDLRHSVLTDQSGDNIYSSASERFVYTEQQSAGGSVAYMHRFRKPARTFSIDIAVNSNETRNKTNSRTQTTYLSTTPVVSDIDQQNITKVNSSNIMPVISYTEPLTANQAMELNYKYRYNNSEANNQVYRFDQDSHLYDQVDSLQSNHFRNLYQTHQFMLSYRLISQQWRIVAGMGAEQDLLKGTNITKNSVLRTHYFSFTPVVNATLGLTPTQQLVFSYNGQPTALSIDQLQPVQSTVDSLFILKGNPHLVQPYMHNASVTYNLVLPSQRTLSVILSGGSLRNAVQNAITQLASGIQVSTPVNMNGTYNASASVNYSFPLQKINASLNTATSFNYQRTPVILNEKTSITHSAGVGESLTFQGHITEQFDYYVNTVTHLFKVRYEDLTSRYVMEQLTINARYYYRDWLFNMSFYYMYNDNLAAGYRKGIPLVSPTVSRQLFKNRAGEIKLSVNDLFQQNLSVVRMTTANTIVDTRTSVRQRYILLSFIYNFRRFNGK